MCDTLKRTLTLRNSFCERWNSELIWGNTQTSYGMFARLAMPIMASPDGVKPYADALGGYRFIGVPLKIAEQFYTRNGLPIDMDAEFSGKDQFALRAGDDKNAYYIEKGYTTIQLNFDREPRFYAR